MTLAAKKTQNKKIVFSTSDDEEPKVEFKSKKPTFKSTVRENGKLKNNKLVFGKNEDEVAEAEVPKFKKNGWSDDSSMKTVKLPRPNKKIVFDENLEEEEEKPPKITSEAQSDDEDANASLFTPSETKGEDNKKWYHVVSSNV